MRRKERFGNKGLLDNFNYCKKENDVINNKNDFTFSNNKDPKNTSILKNKNENNENPKDLKSVKSGKDDKNNTKSTNELKKDIKNDKVENNSIKTKGDKEKLIKDSKNDINKDKNNTSKDNKEIKDKSKNDNNDLKSIKETSVKSGDIKVKDNKDNIDKNTNKNVKTDNKDEKSDKNNDDKLKIKDKASEKEKSIVTNDVKKNIATKENNISENSKKKSDVGKVDNENNPNKSFEKNNLQPENQKSKKSEENTDLVNKDNISSEIQKEKEKINILITELQNKSFEGLREELLIYLELDDIHSYRKKMKGFILPFSSDKHFRIPLEERNTYKKPVDPRTAEEIRRIINKRKEDKLRNEIENEKMLKAKYLEERKKVHEINEKKLVEHERIQIKDGSSYMDIKQKQINFEREKSNKITWDQLEFLNPEYFVTNKEDDFNPQELIGEIENDSDEEYLNNMINKRDFNKKTGKKGMGRSGMDNSGASKFSTNPNNMTNVNNLTNMNNITNTKPAINSSFSNNVNNNLTNSNTKPVVNSAFNNNEKNEKKLKDIEKQWENNKNKLLTQNEEKQKKSMDFVKSKFK